MTSRTTFRKKIRHTTSRPLPFEKKSLSWHVRLNVDIKAVDNSKKYNISCKNKVTTEETIRRKHCNLFSYPQKKNRIEEIEKII